MSADWLKEVACSTFPELWFGKDHQKDAVHICRYHCPVAAECYADSLHRLNIDCVVGGVAYGNAGEVLAKHGGPGDVRLHNMFCRVLRGFPPPAPVRSRGGRWVGLGAPEEEEA